VARVRAAAGDVDAPRDVVGGVVTWLFAPGGHAPVARLGRGEACSIVADQVGAPLVVLGEGGEVKAQLVLDSRGRAEVAGDESVCPWRFAGQYRDDATGLHYNRFRYYDADAGQYISRDPLGLRAGLRVYGYVGDPGVAGDPLGLAPQAGEGCGGGAKRGPKTDPTAPHNATIRAEADALEAEGNTIIAGGGREKERLIKTPGGKKSGRRPDILYETPEGEVRGRNVGRARTDGTPVQREMDALEDLNGPGGIPTDFAPYEP
jgi:RHS repeat-associated protein